jgi:phosphoribosylaminoimidazole-succinocarboxamide synthase
MSKIPISVQSDALSLKIKAGGLDQIHQGKVRDTYALPDVNLLFPFASDRVSIFDFVLSALVPEKGRVLTHLTQMWLTDVLFEFKHHLVGHGAGLSQWLPPALSEDLEIQARGVVVLKLKMLPVECIVRDYLTGSGLDSYKETSHICGHALPAGLHDGSRLPYPLFTPTTKAEEGHDEHINAFSVERLYGSGPEELSLAIFNKASRYAAERGIIIADTKMEFGYYNNELFIGDEIFTPDSSRFWLKEDWEKAVAQKKSPTGYDKQPVREWGKTVSTPFGVIGINKLNPANKEHLEFVHSLTVPPAVIEETTRRYLQIEKMLFS